MAGCSSSCTNNCVYIGFFWTIFGLFSSERCGYCATDFRMCALLGSTLGIFNSWHTFIGVDADDKDYWSNFGDELCCWEAANRANWQCCISQRVLSRWNRFYSKWWINCITKLMELSLFGVPFDCHQMHVFWHTCTSTWQAHLGVWWALLASARCANHVLDKAVADYQFQFIMVQRMCRPWAIISVD